MTETTLSQPRTVPLRIFAVLVLGLTAVSLAAILIRLAQQEGVPSLLIAAGRMAIAAVILGPLTVRRYAAQLRALHRRDLLLIGVSGVFLALHFILWITSLEYTSVLISVVLVTTTPLWSAILEAIFLKAHISRMVMMGLALAITGGVIISLPADAGPVILGSNPLLGSLLAVTGAMAVAVYLVIGRSVRSRLPLMPYIWLVYSVAAVICVLAVLVTSTPITGYSANGYLLLVALALIPQLIGHSSFNYVLEYLSATYVGISTQLEPVIGAILARFLFNEVPHAVQVIGSVIVMTGVILATLGQSSPSGPSANTPET